MEKKDEFVEMRVRTIDEAMKVDELIGHLTFNQVMDDEEKMDIMMLDGQNFKLLLEEVNEPHRMMLGIINPDEADLLYAAVNDPEGTDATLPYQTVHILKELGVTVEKAPCDCDSAQGGRLGDGDAADTVRRAGGESDSRSSVLCEREVPGRPPFGLYQVCA